MTEENDTEFHRSEEEHQRGVDKLVSRVILSAPREQRSLGEIELLREIASRNPEIVPPGRYDLLTAEAIIRNAKPASVSGIYFLIKNHKIVYVGRSINVYSRVGAHLMNPGNKDFDSFFVVPAMMEELCKLETEYIHQFKPKYNSRIPPLLKNTPYNRQKTQQSTARI